MGKKSFKPIIIIGVHRSGTTMFTKALEQFDIFMGGRKQNNNEALFFQNLNKWLFRSTHAEWDYPNPFLGIFDDKNLKKRYVEYLQIYLKSPRLISYLGIKNYLRYRQLANLSFPWGWKDPRNTFTLPLWIEVMGGAHVIHLKRHGLDVARSLVARNEKSREKSHNHFLKLKKYPLLYYLRPKRGGFTHSIRCNTLEGAFDIWREYMIQAENVLQNLNTPYLDLYYENILLQPERELKKVLQFCNQSHLEYKIHSVSSNLNPSRAFAYKNDNKSKQIALENKDILYRFGYREDEKH